MNERTFEALELDSLIRLLVRHCQTPMGRDVVASLVPLTDVGAIRDALAYTTECVECLNEAGSFGLSDIQDPADAIAELKVEGSRLEPLQILAIERVVAVASSLRQQARADDFPLKYPRLATIASGLPDLRPLLQSVAGKILPSGEIDDNASPQLRRIRREIGDMRRRVYSSLESVMRAQQSAIQEELVTIRNGRFVIPVRTDSRGNVAGVVHGLSSSGVTSYVEPLGVIEQNNDLVRLREQEENEIANILLGVTNQFRAHHQAIADGLDAIARTDFVQAKARLSREFKCVQPEISESRRLFLKDARHPILEENLRKSGAGVVPVSLDMDESHQVFIVSGPNAGGKTVALKTAGLLALMAQMGLHVPAAQATLTGYRQVFADIGDQQSIAANLSTFTAHIRNVAEMARAVQAPALVLIDEVGTGTDPDEGAAPARLYRRLY
ncbi:MAG: endonuclease MutS2, partial [Blastocatellia bacterium]